MRGLLVSFLKGLNFLIRKVSAFTHFAQFAVQWASTPVLNGSITIWTSIGNGLRRITVFGSNAASFLAW